MIRLQDGFEIEGTIDTSIVKLNNMWIKIIIVKCNLPIDEVENLLINNTQLEVSNTVYATKGYMKSMVENDITYTWLKFDYSYTKENQTELIDALIVDNLNMQMQIDELILDSLGV